MEPLFSRKLSLVHHETLSKLGLKGLPTETNFVCVDISPFVVKIDISIEPLNIQDHEVRCRNGHKIAVNVGLLLKNLLDVLPQPCCNR